MFKRVIQSISKSLSRHQSPVVPVRQEAAEKTAPVRSKAPLAPLKPTVTGPTAPVAQPSPEEMCGITSKMNKEAIREHLKMLYARFNRSASSLDAKTRKEADAMLDAIVAVREKHFGSI
jgi:hypothetical protein